MKTAKKTPPTWRERLYPERSDEFLIWIGGPLIIGFLAFAAVFICLDKEVTPQDNLFGSVIILAGSAFLIARAGERRHRQLSAKIDQLQAELETIRHELPSV